MTNAEIKELRFDDYRDASEVRDTLNHNCRCWEWSVLYDDENDTYALID